MGSVNVEMIDKCCNVCGKRFKVLKGNKNTYCSKECGSTLGTYGVPRPKSSPGIAVPGEPQKVSSPVLNETQNQSVSAIVQKNIANIIASCGLEGATSLERSAEKDMNATRRNGMLDGLDGAEKTKGASSRPSGLITLSEEPKAEIGSTPAEIKEIRLALSEEFRKNLKAEGLSSARLLQSSGNNLLKLMEESVSSSDLEKAADGVTRVESHRILTAVQCANALTQTVQAQVKILEVLKGM